MAVESRYEMWVCDAAGRRIFQITIQEPRGWEFEYVKVVNGVGKFTLKYPAILRGKSILTDNQIQFWRAGPSTTRPMRLDFLGFLRYYKYRQDKDGRRWTDIKGHDTNGLLGRRIVAYADGTAQATAATIEADDGMKDIVNENLHAGATDTDRDISALSEITFNIDADLTDGPVADSTFAWRRVTDVLEEFNELSYTGGTEVFYELKAANIDPITEQVTYQFRTYTGQPGIDRTDITKYTQRAILSENNGNLINQFYESDARKEQNYIYAVGPAEGENRDVEELSDQTRINASIFNRIEGYADASNVDPDNETAEIQDVGNEHLARHRPRIRAGGRVLNSTFFSYGQHWGHGDKVTIDVFDKQFDGIIRVTELKVKDGLEEVTGRVLHTST
jgi:hypothetical protein